MARGRTKTIGTRLREIRQGYGYTLRDVSEMAGVSQEAISAVERGVRYPTLDTVERLAKALNITVVIGPKRTEVFE